MTDPKHIKNGIDELVDKLSMSLYGMERKDAWEQKICISCKLPIKGRTYSKAGEKEYTQSALCEYCFDDITGK